MAETLSYGDKLAATLRDDPPRRKGDRTRQRLKMSAAKMFEERGYLAVRVSDIADTVGISMASFYVYFQNKRDITLEVLTDFSRYILEQLRSVPHSDDAFEAILAANLKYLQVTQANSGLMRCLVQFSDDDAGFRHSFQATTHEWNVHINRGLRRRFAKLQITDSERLLSIYLLGGMLDQLVRDLYVTKNPYVRDLIDSGPGGTNALARMISEMWLSGLAAVGAKTTKASRVRIVRGRAA